MATTVGSWVLEDRIGVGASGSVWRARRSGAVSQVAAVKRLHADAPADRERLRREVGVLLGLDHPHLVRVLDVVNDTDGVAWSVSSSSAATTCGPLAGCRRCWRRRWIAGVILRANRRRIEVWPEGLRVVNIVTSRSYRWGELRMVRAAPNRLIVDPLEGRRYIGTIVGVWNWRPWLDGPTPAAEIADLAMARAKEHWARG